MDNLMEIWDRCLEILKVDMSMLSFNAYIDGTKPVSFDGSRFILETNNDTQYTILKMKYQPVIEKALTKATGKEIALDLKTPGGVLHADNQTSQPLFRDGLNKSYTFDNFVVGDNSIMAYTASLAVAELPGKVHNPLFIYSAPGLGKTHLMHAIGNYALKNDKSLKVIYTTSESFTNEFINSLQMKKNMQEFRDKYRSCDILLIDDIQFLSKKKETQEEFFHTFNDLRNKNAQIVISSDRPPRDIRDLEERLYSRFSMGLMADIAAPEFETRVAILRNKLTKENLYIEEDVIEYIAQTITSNIRELEGAIQRIKALSNLKNAPITVELTKEAFKGLYDENKPKAITPEKIKRAVCEYMNISLDELVGTKRSRNIVVPRQIAQYLIRSLTNLSYPLIADEFSVKDHTTIIHSCDKIEAELKIDEKMKTTIKDLVSIISK